MQRFLQYLQVLLRWRKLLIVNSAVLTVGAVIVSLLLPHRYSSTARILPPPEDDPMGLTAQLSAGLGGQFGRLRAGIFGGGTGSDLMVGILSSNTVMESVAVQCSVIPRYRIRSGSLQEAVRSLGKSTALSVGDEGIVTISVEAARPSWAAEMANCFVRNLDAFLRSSNISRGRNVRLFVERRLADVEKDFRLAQDSLERFRQQHNILLVDEEAKQAIETYAAQQSELMAQEMRLEIMRQMLDARSPLLAPLEAESKAIRSGLRQMESGRVREGFGVGFSVSLDRLPAVASEYARLYRDYRVLEEAYLILYQQLEHARIMEARDSPTLTILDQAVPPERRSFPRRAIIVLSVLAASLFFGIAFAFGAEYFEVIRETRPDEYARWVLLHTQYKDALRGVFGFLKRRRKPR